MCGEGSRCRSPSRTVLGVGAGCLIHLPSQPWLAGVTLSSKLEVCSSVDEATAEAIRRAWHEGGELSGVVELRRHFPLITDDAKAWLCVRTIVGWAPRPVPKQEQRGQD